MATGLVATAQLGASLGSRGAIPGMATPSMVRLSGVSAGRPGPAPAALGSVPLAVGGMNGDAAGGANGDAAGGANGDAGDASDGNGPTGVGVIPIIVR